MVVLLLLRGALVEQQRRLLLSPLRFFGAGMGITKCARRRLSKWCGGDAAHQAGAADGEDVDALSDGPNFGCTSWKRSLKTESADARHVRR